MGTQISILEEKSQQIPKSINISNLKNYELLIKEEDEGAGEQKKVAGSILGKSQRKKIKRVSFQNKGILKKSMVNIEKNG